MVAEEKLWLKKNPKERWISVSTLNLIDEHMVLKQTLLSAAIERAQSASQLLYKEKDKEIKKSAKKDARLYLENKAALIEQTERKSDF